MAPYASVEQFLSYYGTDRVRTSVPKDVLTADLEDHLLVRLESVSGYMDSYLVRGGYATPVDPSLLSDVTAQERLEALLASVCCALVGQELFVGQRGTGEGQKQARNWAKDWLEDIAAGRNTIAGLMKTSKRIAVVGTADPSIPDTLFSSIRYPF